MPKFRKKPVVVEAEQFFPTRLPWPEGVEQFLRKRQETPDGEIEEIYGWRIDTLEGPHGVSPGDWIITGIKGERYPCKPDIFEATYEPVEETK